MVKRGNKTLVIPEGTPESRLGILIRESLKTLSPRRQSWFSPCAQRSFQALRYKVWACPIPAVENEGKNGIRESRKYSIAQ